MRMLATMVRIGVGALCGFLLLAIMVAMVVLGGAMLRAAGAPSGRSKP